MCVYSKSKYRLLNCNGSAARKWQQGQISFLNNLRAEGNTCIYHALIENSSPSIISVCLLVCDILREIKKVKTKKRVLCKFGKWNVTLYL